MAAAHLVRRTLLTLALGSLFVPTTAWATHDGGESAWMLRFSADGSRILVRIQDIASGECGLRVLDLSGRKLQELAIGEDAPEDASSDLCAFGDEAVQSYLSKKDAWAPVRELVASGGFTIAPHTSPLSPQGDRYVLVLERSGKMEVSVVEGKKLRSVVRELLSRERGQVTGRLASVRVGWHPDGKMAALAGSRLADVSEDGTFYDYAPVVHVLRFPKPPREPLVRKVIADQLNAAGFRHYEAGRFDIAKDYYVAATDFDPSHEQGFYNAACLYARDDEKDQALALLARLRGLGTPKALELLAKTPEDEDFQGMKDDPRLRALVAPAPE